MAGLLIWRVGTTMLGGLARPIPEPPPPGELRKVKLLYRCSICGTELRMTAANDQVPEPPRHCQDDMDLVANLSSTSDRDLSPQRVDQPGENHTVVTLARRNGYTPFIWTTPQWYCVAVTMPARIAPRPPSSTQLLVSHTAPV